MAATPATYRLFGTLAAGAVVVAGAGCPTADKPERPPSGLVKTIAPVVEPIDVSRATRQLDELMRAISMPHHRVGKALGPHRFQGSSTVEVLRATSSLRKIEENVTLELGAKDSYHGVRNLSDDRGREIIFSGGTLYLRPRYSKFHRRAPTRKSEPTALRDELFSTLAAYLQPLAHLIDVGEATETTFAGRKAVKVMLATAAKPRSRKPERLVQRKWRENIEGGTISGHVVLDRESGAPLAAQVSGELELVRDGERLRMKLRVSHLVKDVGAAVAIAVPPPDKTVDTLQRSRETDEHDQLLKGIAPPLGKTAIPSN